MLSGEPEELRVDLNLRIREMIGEYVTEAITFEEFEDRFVGATWGISSRTVVTALECDVEHEISHFTNGAITEGELKRACYRLSYGPFS